MNTWVITYQDDEQIYRSEGTGKLSLDPTWAFIVDIRSHPPAVVLAVPAARIIDIKEVSEFEGQGTL